MLTRSPRSRVDEIVERGVLEWADRDHPIGGLIAAAAEGDQNAAERARAMVRALIETYR